MVKSSSVGRTVPTGSVSIFRLYGRTLLEVDNKIAWVRVPSFGRSVKHNFLTGGQHHDIGSESCPSLSTATMWMAVENFTLTVSAERKPKMKFMQALDALQGKTPDKVFGIFQTKNPTNVITWDAQSHQFRTFYTHKVLIITRQQLFASDWDVIMIPKMPESDYTQEVEDENEI